MGMARHRAYTLLLQGKDVFKFIDGLSTNQVNGACTTVFTNRAAKIVDVCEVIPVGPNVALVGFEPSKAAITAHLTDRILGQSVVITDISELNDVFLGTENEPYPEGTTVHKSHFGTMYIIPLKHEWEATWTEDDWTEHRITNLIPYHGHEITSKVHPLACGLGDLVHPQKGCYIGQEVLTRMRSRGKQGHRLVKRSNPVDKATTVGAKESLVLERI
jgi:folate-binding protein YgfZ